MNYSVVITALQYNKKQGRNKMNLKKTIMRMFDYTSEEADEAIAVAKEQMQEYLDEGDQESAFDICEEIDRKSVV